MPHFKRVLCVVLAVVVLPCSFSWADTTVLNMELNNVTMKGFTGGIGGFTGAISFHDNGNLTGDLVGLGENVWDTPAVLEISGQLNFEDGDMVEDGSAFSVSDGAVTYSATGFLLGQLGNLGDGWQGFSWTIGAFGGSTFSGLSVPAATVLSGKISLPVSIPIDLIGDGGIGSVRVTVEGINSAPDGPQVPVPAAFLLGAMLLGLLPVCGWKKGN